MATTTPKDVCLESSVSVTGQRADKIAIWRVGGELAGHTVRLRIRSDAYREQSHAIAERWDGARWHEVATIPPGGMRTPPNLAYARDKIESLFDDDACALLRTVRLVFGLRGRE